MKLSIVIVNYNVRHFLWQCLDSVEKAIKGIEAEVFMVDNASSDGSVEMVRKEFPWVITIANQENTGFSVANNQAMRMANGAYILLLNPDTIIAPETLQVALAFMDDHPEAGGLGARMLDGSGSFLPESKRGLPTPAVAFYKIFGVSAIFPKSPRFSRYHLGHLDPQKIHEVDVLAGAFMLMRKESLDMVGLLDEQFFMYGEDIDLSYRIVQGGYKNYYHPEVKIIHYKGESTKKGSINYVYVFYRAMVLFARKHFSARFAGIYSVLINMAIWLRASLSIIKRLIIAIRMPALDFSIIYLLSFLATHYWEQNHRFVEGGAYPSIYYYGVVPLYVALWLGGVAMAGGYIKPIRISRIFSGLVGATGLLMVLYGLLPEDWRFSRALILLGGGLSLLWLGISRVLMGLLGMEGYQSTRENQQRILLVTTPERLEPLMQLLRQKNPETSTLYISCHTPGYQVLNPDFKGLWENRDQLIQFFNVGEVVFDAQSLPYQTIINEMERLAGLVTFEIFQPEAGFIIGSDSIHTQGSLIATRDYPLLQPGTQRVKRLFDLSFAIMLLLMTPVLLFTPNYGRLLKHWWSVIRSQKSWVGFNSIAPLPHIKPGVVTPYPSNENPPADWIFAAQQHYLIGYDINEDFRILLRFLRGKHVI
jgi:GT2 family glycosyltransferase